MKRSLLVVFLCFFFLMLNSGFAQQASDPATKEDVQQLFELMQFSKSFDSVIDVMAKQIPELATSSLKQEKPDASPEEIAKLEAFMKDYTGKLFKNMPVNDLMNAMMPAYQHHFTHGEMQELIRFYESPTGKKLLAEMPGIMSEYMEKAQPVMQAWMQSTMAELKKSADEFAKSMQEKKPAPAPKPKA